MPTKISLRPRSLAAAATTPVAPADLPQKPSPAPTSSNLWKGVVGVEGTPTGDGRMIDAGALGWDSLPIPLRYVRSDKGAHEGAVVVGRILSLSRDGALIMGEGDFDMGSEEGCEAQRQVAMGLQTGVSMDLDNISFEYRVSAEAMGGPGEMFDDMMYAAQPPTGGSPPAQPNKDYPPDEPDIGGPGGAQTDAEQAPGTGMPGGDPDGRVTVAQFSPDDEMEVTTSARVRAATLVSLPAFSQCHIAIVPAPAVEPGADSPQAESAAPEPPAPTGQAGVTLTASIPVSPPAAWFANPGFSEPTPLRVSEDGRVSGHLAEWGTCHTGYADQCVSPPQSKTGYAYFRTGSILTREGTEIAVGQLTMDTRHASAEAGATSAMRHYDHTGTAAADVACGEDGFGIWVAGALRPGLSPSQVRTLRASPLSGDWRRLGGNLEMIAALAVNVPGFPVPRTSGLVASGRLQTLVASGMLAPRKVLPPGAPGAFSDDDLRYLKRILAREKADAAALASRQFRTVNSSVMTRAARLAASLRAATPPVPPEKPDAAPATDPDMPADTPKGVMPDPRDKGWLVRGQKWVFDPENDGDDDYTPEGDTDHDYWDASGKQLKAIPASPDGKQPAKPLAASDAPETDPPDGKPKTPIPAAGKTATRIRLRPFAKADEGPWDASSAMGKCHSAADFGSIAFPRTSGDPATEAHWALPHHNGPGEAPNAKGVSSALGRFGQTDGLKDPAAAKAHLEAHDKAIHASDKKPGGK